MIHSLIKILKLSNIIIVIICITTDLLAKERLILGTTTSTFDSGFIDYIRDNFEKKYNYSVHSIAQGTGQIINTAKHGNIDVLITHYRPYEEIFIKNGFGIRRYNLMYNDFVIIGPKDDPAEIKNENDLKLVMNDISQSNSIFVSRSDNSGTHLKELELWNFSNIKVESLGNNYKKIGSGMGHTLNFTNSIKGYTVSDRSTWLSFNNKNNIQILFEGHEKLRNQYAVIIVDPKNKNNKNFERAKIFVQWLLSSEGKEIINNFFVNNQQLFFFNGESYKE